MGRGPTAAYHKDMADGYIKGTLTCLNAEYIKSRINTGFPLVLNIEPTNDCNLSCYLCPRNKGARKVGYMDFVLFKKIIDESKEHGKLRMINFHKDGEPLLHPDIYKMIKFAHNAKVAQTLHLNTNGLLLDKKRCENFLDSGIDDITVSIDAARRSTFKKIKGADLLKRVELNVQQLFELKSKMKLIKPFIRVKIMEFKDITRDEIDEFVKRWSGIADDVQVTGAHNWSGAIRDLEITDEIRERRYPCVLLWYMLAVNWDGKVSCCNVDWNLTAVVGDAAREILHDIWNGPRIKELRRAELVGNHALAQVCKECVVWAGGEDLADYFIRKKEFYI